MFFEVMYLNVVKILVEMFLRLDFVFCGLYVKYFYNN